MRIVNKKLPFTDKVEWFWPDNDEKLLQVFDQVNDIDFIMEHIAIAGVCVQAGGACGVWPYRYSQLFSQVYSFEPTPLNRQCLYKNIEGIENITVLPFALSDKSESGAMLFDKSELNNLGAAYFKAGRGEIKTKTIDSLGLASCDLIQLDIEGYELEALQGAEQTIFKFSPVIVIEEKQLPQMQGRDYKAARHFIESIGYKEVATIHRDVIFKC